MNNKNIKNISHNDELYSSIFDLNNINEGLDFLTNNDSFVQVGTWKYEKGKILDAHYHNTFERKSYITQEVVLVLEGKIICNLYTTDGEFIASEEIRENQLIIQFQGVHEYEILDKSKVLEIKNGPYFGPDKDRTRVNIRND
jgi:quercetin dioxygenase-like cupin family protein